jgi:hypothetical protein
MIAGRDEKQSLAKAQGVFVIGNISLAEHLPALQLADGAVSFESHSIQAFE